MKPSAKSLPAIEPIMPPMVPPTKPPTAVPAPNNIAEPKAAPPSDDIQFQKVCCCFFYHTTDI